MDKYKGSVTKKDINIVINNKDKTIFMEDLYEDIIHSKATKIIISICM